MTSRPHSAESTAMGLPDVASPPRARPKCARKHALAGRVHDRSCGSAGGGVWLPSARVRRFATLRTADAGQILDILSRQKYAEPRYRHEFLTAPETFSARPVRVPTPRPRRVLIAEPATPRGVALACRRARSSPSNASLARGHLYPWCPGTRDDNTA